MSSSFYLYSYPDVVTPIISQSSVQVETQTKTDEAQSTKIQENADKNVAQDEAITGLSAKTESQDSVLESLSSKNNEQDEKIKELEEMISGGTMNGGDCCSDIDAGTW
jgi:phosphoribosylaminoimidazole-succinocarboxamide synthase